MITDPVRGLLWARFAAAAMGLGDPAENTAIAARAADRMLEEFDKRFSPQPGERAAPGAHAGEPSPGGQLKPGVYPWRSSQTP